MPHGMSSTWCVRGGRLFEPVAAPHPNPLPVKNGVRGHDYEPFAKRSLVRIFASSTAG